MRGRLEADVVVVGGGGSGLAAAASAAEAGGTVILLEKNPALGGTTGLSIGSITATRTALQRKAGVEDSPQEHFEDMPLFAGELAARDNEALRRVLVEHVPDTYRWLTSMGLTFFGPMPEPPHRKPRMHNVLPNSRAYIYYLGRRCRKVGVDLRMNADVKGLVKEDGRVVAVDCAIDGVATRVHARKGVILATGDYSAGRDFKARYAPAVADVDAINPTNTGDGMQLGIEAGGRVLNGELVAGPHLRFVAPPATSWLLKVPPYRAFTKAMKLALDHAPAWLLRPFILSFVTTFLAPELTMFREGAILVNWDGERFVDEREGASEAVPRQSRREAFIVFDKPLMDKFSAWPYFVSTAPGVAYAYVPDYRRNRKDLFHQSDTARGLADSIGVPAAALEKSAGALAGGGQPPYFALGPVRGWVVLTDGGLAVDVRHRVLDGNDEAIPGLYAVGSTGQGGLLLEGHGHHLGWAFTSGRRAGRIAAKGSYP